MSKHRLDAFIDRSSLHGFATQLLTAVDDAIAVALHARDGEQLWSTSELEEPCPQSHFGGTQPGKPARVEIGTGRYAYLFPVKASSRKWLVLCILVRRLEPTSLEAVFRAISPVLGCLERQFAVNATLATTTRLPEHLTSQLRLMIGINEFEPCDTLSNSLEALAELCLDGFPCDAIAILLPDADTRFVTPGSLGDNQRFMSLLRRLLEHVKTTGRIGLSVQSLGANSDGKKAVLSAPIMGPSGQVHGLCAAIGQRFSKEDARVARSLTNKIDLLVQQFNCGRPKFLLRDQFLEIVDDTLKRLPGSPHTVLYIDVDKTHLINDSFGYDIGDNAIKTVSELIIKNSGNDPLITHLLGDRFGVLLRQTDSDTAASRAEHILELLNQQTIEREDKSLQLTASIGIATAPFVAESASGLLTIAEVASRGAKERGGNQAVVFESVDASMIQRRSDAEQVGYLQRALLESKFTLYAQEIRPLDKALTTRRFEILLRLHGDGGELVPPQRFLSAAERYQMMAALDRWVVNNTLDALARASSSLEVSLSSFAINISAQSLGEPEFIDRIEQAIIDSGVPPDMLCFELTETAMVRHFERAQHFVHRLQKRGCRVALDDFGTGYSSFAYLKHLPVQYLKIDGAFVRDLLENRLSQAIVSAVVKIAHVMGAATVGEHVENELVQQKLAGLGVDYAQGFHFHRPEPLMDALAALESGDIANLMDPAEAVGHPLKLEVLES
ncbi:MAG: bifunctional diguanylate cyclase/phosphodiesterase [Gammaproteobacteria bacterium]|nr:bifunctional diguanylate cyclase/phosphodiesterase [Gammaproteobacteria bacterium]